jgi:hypothetical protein
MEAVHMIVASWSAVNLTTIVNCFRKAGFIVSHIPRRNEDVYDIREDRRDLSSEIDASDFVICDDDVYTSRLSIEDI